MDRIAEMTVFVRVVEASSFTKVSDLLGQSPATISRLVSHLERRIGVRLLNRSTRNISLTEDGTVFYERCVQILRDISEAESCVSNNARGKPRGTINVETSDSLARAVLLPALCDFQALFQELKVKLHLSDANVDLCREGVDCAIRMGVLDDSSLIARRIGDAQIVTCAAPSYLASYGRPDAIEALRGHTAVHYMSTKSRKILPFRFTFDERLVDVEMKASLAVNDSSSYVAAGLLGYGIIQPFRYAVEDHLKRGSLVELLVDRQPPTVPVSLVYAHRNNLNRRLRVFVDWVESVISGNPAFNQCAIRTTKTLVLDDTRTMGPVSAPTAQGIFAVAVT